MPSYGLYVEMVDAYNRATSKRFESVATLADYAAAAASAAAFITDLAVLTEARILAYTLSERIPFTDAVTSGANKDEGVTFTLRLPDNKKDNLSVPAPINSIFDANGNVITSPSIPAAVADFLANFSDGTGDWTFSDGEQYTEFVKGTLDK